MATIRFNIRDKTDMTKPKPLYLIVTDKGKPILKYPTGVKVSHNDWNEKSQRIRKGNINFDKHNQLLTNFEKIVTVLFADFAAINKTLTGEAIRAELDGLTNRGKTKADLFLCEYIKEYNNRLPTTINPKTGRLIGVQTISKFNCLLAAIQEMEKKERKTFPIDAVDKLFYNRFFGLLQSRNYQPNTVGKYIESLKTILHEAESKGVKVNVFLKDKKFIIPYADVSNEYLNEKEIKILQELDLTDKPRLERVRDVFMIGCKTGQRYQTYSKFTKDMFENDRIKIYQRKNSNQVIIPIDNYVTDIMEKYNWKLPCIASQKFNEYIKEVCQLAGFDQPISKTVQMGTIMKTIVEPKYEIITSHTARRSYATNMYLRDKGAMISIMKATGHKSVKMFLKYVLASDEEHLSIMRDIQNGVPKEPIRLKVANS